MTGGSEFRCVFLANAISKYTKHEAYLLAEHKIPEKIEKAIDDNVIIVKNIFRPTPINVQMLYKLDSIIVVNTDCKHFSNIDYWKGQTDRHDVSVDLTKIKQLVFLYNFLVSPSRNLYAIQEYCNDVRILVTNSKFFNEISDQSRYAKIKAFPRMKIESPIDPETISIKKTKNNKIRIGCLSKSSSSKWNIEYPKLISQLNKRFPDQIIWNFMGMNSHVAEKLKDISDVNIYKEFQLTVKDFLKEVDIFLFFPSWKREEPWSRAVAEGMMSGCPVVTTNKGGNKDQIVHLNNGYLCNNLDEMMDNLSVLIEDQDKLLFMRHNMIIYSAFFSSEYIINKIMAFIKPTSIKMPRKKTKMDQESYQETEAIKHTINDSIWMDKDIATDSMIQKHNQLWLNTINESEDRDWFNLFAPSCSEKDWFSSGILDFFTYCLTDNALINLGKALSKCKAIEIGSGGGRLLCAASSIFNKIYGIDIYDENERTSKILEKYQISNCTLLNDISSIKDDDIDFVYSYSTFGYFIHLRQIFQYFNEINRVLTKDGIASICYHHLISTDENDYCSRTLIDNPNLISLKVKPFLMEKIINDAGLRIITETNTKKFPWSQNADISDQKHLLLKKMAK